MSELILEVKNVFKSFSLESSFFSHSNKTVYAVNDVSFKLMRGETYGIVGESGCGKTTTARMIIKMYKPTKGNIFFYDKENAQDIFLLNKKESHVYREKVKYIFQDPSRSLNPRRTVFSILTDAFKYSLNKVSKDELFYRAAKVIQEVGLTQSDLFRRPQDFSGGQRQRISIARALIMCPELLICDEVVSALDVSIQGQIINLLQEIREKKNLSMIFITHDLKVALYFCDRIGVMYRGVLVEESSANTLYKDALHPYTKLLFLAASGNALESNVEVKSTLSQENGCPFAHRCPNVQDKCLNEEPPLLEVSKNHFCRCHFVHS